MIRALAERGDVVLLGEGETAQVWTASAWQRLVKQLHAMLTEYHARHPARPGIPRLEVTGKLKLGNTAPLALKRLLRDGVVAAQGDVLHRPDHEVKLTAAQRTALDAFVRALKASPYNPPSETIPEPDLVNLLAARGEAVKVSDSVVFGAGAYAEMVRKIKEHIQSEGSITLGGVRDLFGTSRKYAQALLEHLDAKKITRRVGDTRELF